MDCAEQALAWEMFHDPNIGGRLDAEHILELALKAGYSENVAQKVASKRAEDRLRLELPP